MSESTPISAGQMKRVLELTRLLTVTADLDLLLTRIAEAACEVLSCERASIFLHDPKTDELWTKVALQSTPIRVPGDAGIVGHCFRSNQMLHVAQPYRDPRFNPEPDRRSGFITRDLLTAPMLDLAGRPVGVIQAVNKRAGAFDAIDETMVQLLAAQAGVAIQRYNLQQAAVDAMAMRREMELARAVQQKLIPHAPPQIVGLQAAGWTQAASVTGGDCYDLWETGDGRLGIFMGDATGHGIGPAMVVSQTRTMIRGMCDANGPDPRRLLECANARLAQDLDAGHFVTAFVGFLSSDGVLDWCSAGQAPVLVRAAAGAPLESLDAPAPPLGVIGELCVDLVPPRHLRSGGLLCLASDGILECFSPAHEEFGVARLDRILADGAGSPLHSVLVQVQAAMRQWQGADEPRDDQTLVIARANMNSASG